MGVPTVPEADCTRGRSSSMCARAQVLDGAADTGLLEYCLSFVDTDTLISAISTSKTFASAATSDAVWELRCRDLWFGKVYVPNVLRGAGVPRIAAYFGSIADSSRTAITTDELCSLAWYSRMKSWAGNSWTEPDPWWNGRPPFVRR